MGTVPSMYRVTVYFEDLQDDRHAYSPGDVFPRDGLEVSDERLQELSTDANRRGVALIERTDTGLEDDGTDTLGTMSKAELLALAEDEGVEVKSSMNKAEISAAIEEARGR